MAFRFAEKPGSGNSALRGLYREKLYYAAGSTDDSFVLGAAAAATPVNIFAPNGKLFRQEILTDWSGADYCDVRVIYGPRDPDQMSVQFDTAGSTVHITSSLGTVNRYAVVGQPAAPDLKGTIGLNKDDVDGCDISVPALKLSISKKHPQGVITLSQVRTLARYTAYVNQDIWLGFQPGEVLFLGATGGWGPETETTVTYQFACAENCVDGAIDKRLTIGDITNIVKQGHDYCWVRYEDAASPDGFPIKQAKHVYVERVYKRASFVGIFGFN